MSLIDLIDTLHKEDCSLVLEDKNGKIRLFYKKGVRDLEDLLNHEPETLKGAVIADKVIGKAAAGMMAYGGVVDVYADVLSRKAIKILEDNGVKYSYGTLVDQIVIPQGDKRCPLEKIVATAITAEEIVKMLNKHFADMSKHRNIKERYDYILNYFREKEPNVNTELQFGSAFQLLCATILSAQCTDKRINEVTPALFQRYPTPQLMAQADPEDILEFIHSVSYPNSKSRHLVAMAKMLVDEYGGQVPDDPKQLLRLPGVGRKTANVLQAVWFGKATMAVDTHVYRVAHRLGLVPQTANTPFKVEQYLMKNIPKSDIPRAHHWLLLHGRYICQSAKPHCERCPFDAICPKLLDGSKL